MFFYGLYKNKRWPSGGSLWAPDLEDTCASEDEKKEKASRIFFFSKLFQLAVKALVINLHVGRWRVPILCFS